MARVPLQKKALLNMDSTRRILSTDRIIGSDKAFISF